MSVYNRDVRSKVEVGLPQREGLHRGDTQALCGCRLDQVDCSHPCERNIAPEEERRGRKPDPSAEALRREEGVEWCEGRHGAILGLSESEVQGGVW
jgi:hypothetical protein